MEVVRIPIDEITINPEIQVRFSMRENKVEEYTQRIRAGLYFPPIHCGILKNGDGTKYLVDGFHRLQAYTNAGADSVEAEIAEYETLWEMDEYALRVNKSHGIDMTEDEVKARTYLIIQRYPNLSERELAKKADVSPATIHRRIHELLQVKQLERPEKTIGRDGKERPAIRPAKPDYTLCPKCGTPIWPENKGNPDYTYTERDGQLFCSPECADEYEQERLSDEAEAITGIPDELPDLPSAALPTHEEDEPEPVKHETEPVLTEDDENQQIADEMASLLKNFRPQRINNILIIFLFKNLKLTLKNLSNIINARRSKNDELPEEEKTGFKWKLNDGTEWELPKSDMEELRPLYPAIDFEEQLRLCIAWNLTNPKYRKTKSGILKHINTWLRNEQNKATKSGSQNRTGRKSGYVSRDAGLDFENLEY